MDWFRFQICRKPEIFQLKMGLSVNIPTYPLTAAEGKTGPETPWPLSSHLAAMGVGNRPQENGSLAFAIDDPMGPPKTCYQDEFVIPYRISNKETRIPMDILNGYPVDIQWISQWIPQNCTELDTTSRTMSK